MPMAELHKTTLHNWRRADASRGAGAMQIGALVSPRAAEMTKRIVDVSAAFFGGLLLLPLIAIIVIAVKATSPGPVFFCQTRLGRRGREIQVWKFRTMIVNAGAALAECLQAEPALAMEWRSQHKIINDPRVTWLGRLLRRTSLDELPQLWNVLRGDMSLVGPRPIVRDEIPRYGATYELYQRVLPGITGLWQVSGRNNTTYAQRVHLDAVYVRTWTLWLDLSILLRTVWVVLSAKGAY